MAQRNAMVVAVALVMFVFSASAALAGGGNSAGAKQCQKDGWRTSQTDSGGAFASNDACTSYAAKGGTVFSPTVVPEFEYCESIDDSPFFTLYGLTAYGFHANSVVTFQGFYPVASDEFGVATVPGLFMIDVGPASATATDAQGLHASVDFTAACPG
jgi:hypothetical protein